MIHGLQHLPQKHYSSHQSWGQHATRVEVLRVSLLARVRFATITASEAIVHNCGTSGMLENCGQCFPRVQFVCHGFMVYKARILDKSYV